MSEENLKNVKDTLYIGLHSLHKWNKYLVDFNNCNIDFIKSIKKDESLIISKNQIVNVDIDENINCESKNVIKRKIFKIKR